MNELKKTVESIVEKFPNYAVDIADSLDILSDTINVIIDAINEESAEAMKNRDYEYPMEVMKLAKILLTYDNHIKDIQMQMVTESTEEADNKANGKNAIPNYDDYKVDTTISHNLYEDFTHTRPAGFEILNSGVKEINLWKEMFVETCKFLIDRDASIFETFIGNPKMNGRKRKFFATTNETMHSPIQVSKWYVETNCNSNFFRNIVRSMLQQYNLKTTDFKIYLRADYKELHKS